MNSGNKLLLGILAFVVACVVGYALFSESITITGSASAKGDGDIDVSCTKGVSDSLLQGIDITRKEAKEGGYQNDSCTVDGMNVSFNTELLYPTATRYFTVKVTNKGNIKATYDNSDGLKTKEGEFCYDGQNTGGVKDGVIKESDDCISAASFDLNFIEVGPIAIETKDGTILGFDSDDLSKYYNEDTGIITIDNNESIIFIAVNSWLDDPIASSDFTDLFARQSRTYEFVLNQKLD